MVVLEECSAEGQTPHPLPWHDVECIYNTNHSLMDLRTNGSKLTREYLVTQVATKDEK